MDPQVLLPLGAGLVVEQVRLCDEILHLTVRCEAVGASCPDCGSWSEAFHSGYERNLADLPIAGRQAVVDLHVRRFRCYQSDCPRKTFVEQAPVLAERYAHRTVRLRSMLESIGFSLGGRPGSRHCQRLSMATSRTTLLRMVRAVRERPIGAGPCVLGVDEFALRRGRRYGTILVDVGTHQVVDLLEDPSADALVEWLGHHPGTEVICRDRDGVYASAARRGAPEALQVADRWHLTHNLAEALERFSVRALAMLRTEWRAEQLPSASSPSALPSPSPSRTAVRTERRHAEIHVLLAQGLSLRIIARQLGLDRRTVRKFADAEAAVHLLSRGGDRRSKLDPFLPYLAQRWADGQQVASVLFTEIQQRGYPGRERTVQAHLARWRTTEPTQPVRAMPSGPLLPGPRNLAWLLLRRPSDLDDKDQKLLDDLCEKNVELVSARKLAQHFLRLVRERPGGRAMDDWADAVQSTGPPELRGFVRNLQRDWHAVSAGLTRHWSSGSVEGNVNKLKVIKRQMFGRARFDLLRKRVLLAN